MKIENFGILGAPSAIVYTSDKLTFGRGTQVTVEPHNAAYLTNPQIFGKGIRLEVTPRFQETSVPSVFVMKNGTNVACLVKDFYPKTVEIQLHPDNNPSEGVVATADGKFSAVKLGQYKKDLDQINCTVWHNNKVVVASYKGSYSNSKISGSPLPKECYKPTAQIEKVNLLSITLLGFRVLLAKSIAVNFVLTIKFFLL